LGFWFQAFWVLRFWIWETDPNVGKILYARVGIAHQQRRFRLLMVGNTALAGGAKPPPLL
jgi:hypothetical protein